MSRVLGEKDTGICVMRKYSSMQNWPKDCCEHPHLLCSVLEKSAATKGRPEQCAVVSEPLFYMSWEQILGFSKECHSS